MFGRQYQVPKLPNCLPQNGENSMSFLDWDQNDYGLTPSIIETLMMGMLYTLLNNIDV